MADWSEWIRSPADERAVEQGCWFDIVAAERVRTFFRRFLRHSKGQWANQPFELLGLAMGRCGGAALRLEAEGWYPPLSTRLRGSPQEER